MRDAKGEIIAKLKKYIGRTTNNVAEYYGLIAALDYAQAHGVRALQIESDSELLVKQMRGQYKVKSEDLRPLFERAKKMATTFEFFAIGHVYREQNKEADELANEAMDESAGKVVASGAPAASKPVTASAVAETKTAGVTKPTAKPDTSGIPRKVRARYRSGILYPLEDLDLEDGIEVEIYLRATPKKPAL